MINIRIFKENDYILAIDHYSSNFSHDETTKIHDKLEVLLNKINLGMNINKIVKTIRAVIPVEQEDMLNIHVANPSISYRVNYMNGNLHGFNYTERIDITHIDKLNSAVLKVQFYKGQLNAYIENCDKNRTKEEIDYLTAKMNEGLKEFYDLQNYEPYKLSSDDKNLLESYKLFYGEKADFADPFIEAKIQCMICFLSENGIVISTDDENIGFGLGTNGPESMVVKSWIHKILPFMNNYEYVQDPHFAFNLEKKIAFLGSKISELTENLNDEEKSQMVIDFLKLYILKKHRMPSKSTKEITNYGRINRPKKEIDDCLKLIRQLEETEE